MANKKTLVDEASGIPLIGSNAFGLVDRNTSLVEVKPITGCNLNCIFCSVDEGASSRKVADFVVEKNYLVKGFKKLAEFKRCKVEAHINAHGEPLLYSEIVDLVRSLSSSCVHTVSMDTNGILLNEELVDELIDAGMTHFNLSINSLDEEVAKKLAGTNSYNVKKVKKIAEYIAKKGKGKLVIAPVWVPGFNDDEIPKIIKFSLGLGARIGIQNFLNYRFGRNPAKQMPWKIFYSKLAELEKVFKAKLILSEESFGIHKTIPLPKPFKKGDVIEARLACDGRYLNEKIAVADDRNITVPNCGADSNVRVRIVRSKHNVFVGRLL
jgi:hypothetical protein